MTARDLTLVGQVVMGRYRVLRRLAQGGMGAVYLARTEGARGFTKPVVIKRILSTLGDEDASHMFAREARILSMLQDPGIVSVLDFGQEPGGDLVMVLDYVHGYHVGHFQRYLQKAQHGMPCEMALYIMIRVLEALHYAHTFRRADGTAMQIIHRDVSPANILLDVNGHLKLVDFGIARAQGDNDEYHTQTPRLKGKFAYLPVELFKGAEPTVQADVYASGVVLYELLTGDNPFRGRELADTYHKVLNVVPTPVATLRRDAPAGIDAVITKALSKNQRERYASAHDFAEALRALRTISDEQGRALLQAEVQHAFAGPLAQELDIEPLSIRDTAWRAGTETDKSLESVSTIPPPPSAAELVEATQIENDLPTRTASPLTLAGDAALRSEPDLQAGAASLPPGPPSLPPGPLDPESMMHSALTVSIPRRDSDRSSPRDSAPAPGGRPSDTLVSTQPPAGYSAQLAFWVAIGSALALGALVFWRTSGRAPTEQKVVVIERQPAAAIGTADPAAAPSAPQAVAAAPAPATTTGADATRSDAAVNRPMAVEASAAERKPRNEIKPTPAAAAATDPKLLTRAFAHEQGRIQACFVAHDAAAAGHPQWLVGFRINTAGVVESAELSPADATATPLGKCLLAVAKSTRFPKQRQTVSFQIPLATRRVDAH